MCTKEKCGCKSSEKKCNCSNNGGCGCSVKTIIKITK